MQKLLVSEWQLNKGGKKTLVTWFYTCGKLDSQIKSFFPPPKNLLEGGLTTLNFS